MRPARTLSRAQEIACLGVRAVGDDVLQRQADPNGWTVRSTDGSRAAHVEHTIVITDNGPVVLTALA